MEGMGPFFAPPWGPPNSRLISHRWKIEGQVIENGDRANA